MQPWEEQLAELRKGSEIAEIRAKDDAEIAQQLIPAFYFLQESAKKLRHALAQTEGAPARHVQGAFCDVLRGTLALIRTTEASGLSVQIEVADALKLLREDLASLSAH
jgi:hypothetical protein